MRSVALIAGLLACCAGAAQAADPAEEQALELVKRGIAFRTVAGPGNQTPQYAEYLKSELVKGGFAPEDVTITPLGDTAYMVARYRGTGKGLKPIYVSGHMDVVEAKPADWQRDPFTPVIENGFLFGRGANDMKTDMSTMVAALIALKKEGYRPKRDILLLASGDEETRMATARAMAERYHDAELLVNIDGGGGDYDDETGKPLSFAVGGAEKSYADFEIGFTNPGGHSSAPRKKNAIYDLAHALERVEAYQWPGQVNEITRASFLAMAPLQPDRKLGDAMRRFATDPTDREALATLRADPGWVGQTGTTCVATQVSGGHATNALPQRATANINCRIFPGTSFEQVRETLTKVVGMPDMTIRQADPETSTASPASPLRPDLMQLVTRLVHARFPQVPVMPTMGSGASDSMWFRAKGVPSYGVSPIFIKESDSFSHGLNERVPLSEIGPSVTYYRGLLKGLAG